jgi:hypothetical protein
MLLHLPSASAPNPAARGRVSTTWQAATLLRPMRDCESGLRLDARWMIPRRTSNPLVLALRIRGRGTKDGPRLRGITGGSSGAPARRLYGTTAGGVRLFGYPQGLRGCCAAPSRSATWSAEALPRAATIIATGTTTTRPAARGRQRGKCRSVRRRRGAEVANPGYVRKVQGRHPVRARRLTCGCGCLRG